MKEGWYIINNNRCFVQKLGNRMCYWNPYAYQSDDWMKECGWHELSKEQMEKLNESSNYNRC